MQKKDYQNITVNKAIAKILLLLLNGELRDLIFEKMKRARFINVSCDKIFTVTT